MKPGDLVKIADHAGYYSYQSPIGMLIEIKDEERLANPYVVLVDGELRQFNPFELAPVQMGGEHGMIGSQRRRSLDRFFKVKVTMICEKSVEVEVAVGLDELTPDEDGTYSGDAINDRAEELARQCIGRNYDFDHMELDASEIVAPDNVEYWC